MSFKFSNIIGSLNALSKPYVTVNDLTIPANFTSCLTGEVGDILHKDIILNVDGGGIKGVLPGNINYLNEIYNLFSYKNTCYKIVQS